MSLSLCLSVCVSQSLWRTSLALDDNLSSTKVMCRSLALTTDEQANSCLPGCCFKSNGCVATLSVNRIAGLTVKMKYEFAKGEPGLCLWVLAPGTQPLIRLDQHHIPGRQAQSPQSNWRCTKCDMIHLGHYISRNMGFLSICRMAEPQRWFLKWEHELKAIQLVDWGPPTPQKTLEALSFPCCCWYHKALYHKWLPPLLPNTKRE